MWEVVVGAILGTLTSIVIAEIYQRRSNRVMDRRLLQIRELHEQLDAMLQDAVYFSEKAARKADEATRQAKEAWLVGVRGTPEDPDFPYK